MVRFSDSLGASSAWVCSNDGVAPLDRGLLRTLGTKSLLTAGIISTPPMEDQPYRGDGPVSMNAVIKGIWPIHVSRVPNDVLAIGMPNLDLEDLRFQKSWSSLSHQEIQQGMTQKFVEYLGLIRRNSEMNVSGATIVKHGVGNALEEVRAGEHVETQANLFEIIGEPPKSTTYFAWGNERSSVGMQQRFVAELSIRPKSGEGVLAETWRSIVGDPLIPFEINLRSDLIAKVRRFPNLDHRITKWTKHILEISTTAKSSS
jgi:hypothetical protein